MHTYFSFLKSFIWSKSKGLDFSVNIFWQSSNWAYSKNKLYKTSDSSIFEKGPGLFYPPYLSTNFQKICVSHAIFNQLTKFHCLIAFTFWDIWQYLYCDCLCESVYLKWKKYLHDYEKLLKYFSKKVVIIDYNQMKSSFMINMSVEKYPRDWILT